MIVTVSLCGPQAEGLGFLLHKHPDRVQTFSLPVGQATVFYPEATPQRCTAALLLEVDPIGLARRRGSDGLSLFDYVTDRPYAASSMLAVALGRVFGTALSGRCDARPELAASPLPLEIEVPAVPVRAAGDRVRGAELVRRLFEPLGWQVETTTTDLAPGWGPAPYVSLRLTGSMRLATALAHLYVLLPVLDDAKHYWVGADEVDKLLRRGDGWLGTHPERPLILRRYLASRRSYVADATARLDALDEQLPGLEDTTDLDDDADTADAPQPDETPTQPLLRDQRLQAVLDVVAQLGAHRIVDIGCGEGYYLRALLPNPAITELVGTDVSARELARAEKRLRLDRRPERQRAKLTLRQSSVTYRDDSLAGYDACLLIEVIEHIQPDRLPSLEASVFGAARPAHVVVTTPNREYNAVYGMPEGALRHPDHRFEWTRTEFSDWARAVAEHYGYTVEFRGVGAPESDMPHDVGTPTQMAVFTRQDEASAGEAQA